jgi:hypothetical protein
MQTVQFLFGAHMNSDKLRKNLHHMDEQELLVFGRTFRGQPESAEYKEAQAEWKRRQEKKTERESRRKREMVAVETSWDIARIALYAPPDAYPWACFAITRPGHFAVLALPKADSRTRTKD